MRIYLVDGTNALRRGGWDARFPEVEAARADLWLGRLSALAGPLSARVRVEVFLDGPRRAFGCEHSGIALRFCPDGKADEAILGTLRCLRERGKGVVVATMDGGLAEEAREEGARVIGFEQLESRLRGGRA